MGYQKRIIALIDMDCFYAQVEQRLQPQLWGKPVVVVSERTSKGGGILAVSYEAREFGIKRNGMFGDEAKKLCPEVTLCYVPVCEHSDKADLSRYRNASDEVFQVIKNFDSRIIVERASIDEAFLDLTELVEFVTESEDPAQRFSTSLEFFPSTHIANGKDVNEDDDPAWQYDRKKNLCQWLAKACVVRDEELKLAVAAEIVEQIRMKIEEETKFHCSAGIAVNKMLAKLMCSRHKPKQQTVICSEAVPKIFRSTSIRSVRNLGGKLGAALMEHFNIKNMSELSTVPLEELSTRFPAQATWIYNLAKGIDEEAVKPRDKQTTVAVSKSFVESLTCLSDVEAWLNGLSKEIAKRLIEDQLKNLRTARTMHVGFITAPHRFSKSFEIKSYDATAIFKTAWSCMRDFNTTKLPDSWDPPIINMSMTAGRFQDGVDTFSKRITDFMSKKAEMLLTGTEEVNEPSVVEDESSFRNNLVTPRDDQIVEATSSNFKRDDYLPKSFDEIPKDVLASMPEDIRKEITQYCKGSGIDGPSASGTKPFNAQKKLSGRKRKKQDAEPVASKKISHFFQKKS